MSDKELIKYLKMRAGKKCKTAQYGCFKCDKHYAIEILEHWFDVEATFERLK